MYDDASEPRLASAELPADERETLEAVYARRLLTGEIARVDSDLARYAPWLL